MYNATVYTVLNPIQVCPHNADKLYELSSVRAPLSQVLRPSPISPEGDIGSGESPFPCRSRSKTVSFPSWVRGFILRRVRTNPAFAGTISQSYRLGRLIGPERQQPFPCRSPKAVDPSWVRGSCNITQHSPEIMSRFIQCRPLVRSRSGDGDLQPPGGSPMKMRLTLRRSPVEMKDEELTAREALLNE